MDTNLTKKFITQILTILSLTNYILLEYYKIITKHNKRL